MKPLSVAAFAACLATVACLLAFKAGRESGENSALENNVQKLAVAVQTNSETISLLRLELGKISNHLSVTGGQAAAEELSDVEPDDVAERLRAVEDALAVISQRSAPAIKDATDSSVPPINRLSQESIERSSARRYELAEEKFESGSGIPLGGYVSAIDDTLHTLGNIEVQEMDCRDTICKITYTQTETSGSRQGADEDLELVDKLAQAAEGREVEITYATDPAGDELMYIQVR